MACVLSISVISAATAAKGLDRTSAIDAQEYQYGNMVLRVGTIGERNGSRFVAG